MVASCLETGASAPGIQITWLSGELKKIARHAIAGHRMAAGDEQPQQPDQPDQEMQEEAEEVIVRGAISQTHALRRP